MLWDLLVLLVLLKLLLLLLLVHLWVGRAGEVLRSHDGDLLVIHAHAKLHVVLVHGLLAILLHLCSAVLEPILHTVSQLVCTVEEGKADVDLVEGHAQAVGEGLLDAGGGLVLLLKVLLEDVVLVLG
jgi:hypothetical protein